MATNFPNDTSAAALADADLFLFADASDSYNAKEATWATMKAGLGYERTSAEVSAGIAAYSDSPAPSVGDIVSPEYAPGDIRRYGADTGAADNTAAIQAAINQCSHGGPNPYVPVGKYVHTSPLYYYYDASNNPDFMSYTAGSTDYRQGHIRVTGERTLTRNAWQNGVTEKGSNLHFEPSSGTGNGHLVGNDTLGRHRHYQFHDVTISGNTSGALIIFKGTTQKAGMWRCTAFQEGTGSGLLVDDCFEFHVHETIVESTNTVNAGWGIKIWNSTNPAGDYVLMNSNFKGFQYGAEIGEYDYLASPLVTYYTLQNVLLYCVELGGNAGPGTYSDYGLRLGSHIESIVCDGLYIENCTESCVAAAGQQQTIILRGGTYGANQCTLNAVVLGVTGSGSPGSDNRQQSTIIEGVCFTGLPSNLSYIERNVGGNTGSLIVRGCQAGPASSTGTAFVEINGDGAGVSIDGNDLYASSYTYANEYTCTSGDIDFYRSGNRQDGTLGDMFIRGVRVNQSKSYTGADDLDMSYPLIRLDSTSGAFTVDVQDGKFTGQIVEIYMQSDGGDVSVDFATDSTSHSSIGTTGRTFNDVGDFIRVMWTGAAWRLIDESGTAAYA